MPAQKFIGPNNRDTLRLVRQQLGGEAIILSSRDVPEGVEVMAIAPQELESLARSSAAMDAAPDAGLMAAAPAEASPGLAWAPPAPTFAPPPQPAPALAPLTAQATPDRPFAPEPVEPPLAAGAPWPAATAGAAGLPAFLPQAGPQLDGLVHQFNQMRDLLQAHLSDRVWGDLKQSQDHALLLRHLLNAGFSPGLCAQLLKALPADAVKLPQMMELIQQEISRQVQVMEPLAVLDPGGIFAFIGPTGVGKTTAIAKIAARCVLRFGREQLVLMTTDNFRIGAQEQLKVYAKILGVSYVSVQDKDDFAHKLRQLAQRRIVLLDTAGVSQRDIQMLEQAQLLYEGAPQLKRLLVMSSTTDLRTLEDVILMNTAAVKTGSGQPALAGAIITKIDEAAQLGPVLDCLIRHQLPLLFLSNGQRVPEDLSQANVAYLVHRALHPRALGESLQLQDHHVPALMADELSAWALRPAS
jgi:flagellar biosynthesis protein FlhF